MPLIIPNAGDTTGGNKYESLDQAEPDALDFEVLSSGGSGVVSGCEVTTNNSNATVAVAAGVVVLAGVPYAVAANAGLAIPASPADNRFDIVVARVSGGSASLVVVQGANSGTNPTYPQSASVIIGAPSPTTNVDLSTDVVLAALYRSGSSAVTTSRIVDKRALRTSSVVNQGSAAPSTLIGSGALYMKTGDPVGPASGLFIQTSTGSWIELAQNTGSHLPIGAAVAWPSKQAVPAGCVELNGQALATAAFPAAFSVWGYDHGGAGATFNAPNWNNLYLRGTTSPSAVGTSVGADSVTLSTAQLPVHAHSMNNHTHTLAHSHDMTHGHSGSTGSSGVTVSGTTDGQVSNTRAHHYGNPSTYQDSWYDWEAIVAVGGWPTSGPSGILYGDIGGVSRLPPGHSLWDPYKLQVWDYSPHTHTATLGGGSHAHSLTVNNFNGSTGGASSTTTSQATGNTGNVGSGSSVDVRPASTHTRWIARVSLGNDSAVLGATRMFSHSIELRATITTGDKYLWVAPFNAAIETVRAYRLDGTTFVVNVKVDNTTVLGADLGTASADTWYSASADAYTVPAGALVEVNVVSVTGAPTLAYVQVDFTG